jgi:hypothetical protein
MVAVDTAPEMKKGFSCPGVPYTRKGSLLVLSDRKCVDGGFVQLDDGFVMGHAGDEISIGSGSIPWIDLRLKYKGVLPVPIVLHRPAPTPTPIGPTPVGPPLPPTPSPYAVMPGLYEGKTVFSAFRIHGAMTIHSSNSSLDMQIDINSGGPAIINVSASKRQLLYCSEALFKLLN